MSADPFAGIGQRVDSESRNSDTTAQGSALQAARRSQRASPPPRVPESRASQRVSGPAASDPFGGTAHSRQSGGNSAAGLNQSRSSYGPAGTHNTDHNATAAPYAGPGRFAHEHDPGADRPRIDYDDWLRQHAPSSGDDSAKSADARAFLETAAAAFARVVAVKNAPLSVAASEVTLAFAEPRGQALVTLADVPSARTLQDESSDSASPSFTGCAVNARVRPKAQLLITVTCIDHRTRYCGVLGHAVVPIWNRRGVFEVRLREGRPNTGSGAAAAVHLPLTSVVVHVNVRPGEGQGEHLRLFDFSHNEELLIADRTGRTGATMATHGFGPVNAQKMFDDFAQRRAANAATEKTAPGGNAVVVGKQQQQRPGDVAKERPLDVAFYAPYNEKRGVALVVHGLYYCVCPDRSPLQLFKVVLEVDGRRAFTRQHDWAADANRPKFQQAYFVFPGVRMRGNLAVVLRVYRMRFHPHAVAASGAAAVVTAADSADVTPEVSVAPTPADTPAPSNLGGAADAGRKSTPGHGTSQPRGRVRDKGNWSVEEYGWGAVSLVSAVGAGVLRHSATSLVRLYQGRVPSNLVDVIQQSDNVDYALGRLLEAGDIQLHRKTVGTQSPIMSLSVCDPARLDEVVAERRSSSLPPELVLHEQFKRQVWPNPSEVEADANAYFKAAVFGA